MASWPDALAVKDWARIPDSADDGAIAATVAAVRGAVIARCPTLAEVDDPAVPDDVALAVVMWCTRLLARRNSPEGVVGVGDMGVANIGNYDPDVGRLLAPWTAQVIA